jgi:mRNA interferase HigB
MASRRRLAGAWGGGLGDREALVEKADWTGPAQLKDQLRSASFVGDRVVFNIAGNTYRLVAVIKYRWRMVYIRFVGAHTEYDGLNRTGRLESM